MEFEGTWKLSGYKNTGESLDCKITFVVERQCVFEEEFHGGKIGRFWFYYKFNEEDSKLTLIPVNEKLRSLYKGKERVLKLKLLEEGFRIEHSEDSYSDYSLEEVTKVPLRSDQFPIYRNRHGEEKGVSGIR